MTDLTDELSRAVQAYISAEYEDDTVLSFVVIAQSQSLETPGSNYRVIFDETQQFHVTAGLIDVGARVLDDIWNDEDDDDDD